MMGPGPSCPEYTVGLAPLSLSNADLVSVSHAHHSSTKRMGRRRMASLKRAPLRVVILHTLLRLTVGSGYRETYGT